VIRKLPNRFVVVAIFVLSLVRVSVGRVWAAINPREGPQFGVVTVAPAVGSGSHDVCVLLNKAPLGPTPDIESCSCSSCSSCGGCGDCGGCDSCSGCSSCSCE